jgi:hypothetical protein
MEGGRGWFLPDTSPQVIGICTVVLENAIVPGICNSQSITSSSALKMV